MRITINQQCRTPYFRQIKNQLKDMILKGEITDGTMLPSERSMAELCRVHRNTVIKAYHELKADGFITSSQGKGYVVVSQSETAQKEEHINWDCLIRSKVRDMNTTYNQLLTKSCRDNMISFVGGPVGYEIYPQEVLAQIGRMVDQDAAAKADIFRDVYHSTYYQGMPELRNQLALFLKGKGIAVSARQIQVVSNVNQAVDILAEMFLESGDAILIEEPLTPDLYRLFQLKDVNVITVPTDRDGIIAEAVEPLIRQYRPRMIYVNSSFQDPSGVNTSLARRKELLQLSYQYGVPIVEEDGASELYFDHQIPSYMALDRGKSVIYMYSFELTFMSGVRIACVAAPRQVIENMSKVVAVGISGFDTMSQTLLYHSMQSGIYQQALNRMRNSYLNKRDLMYGLLKPLFDMGARCDRPKGGRYLWIRLPDDTVEGKKLWRCAEKRGVLFVPGELFFPFGTGGAQYIRLNYSYATEDQIRQGIPLLIQAVEEAMSESRSGAEETGLCQ